MIYHGARLHSVTRTCVNVEAFAVVPEVDEQIFVFISTSGFVSLVGNEAGRHLSNDDDPMPFTRAVERRRNIDWRSPRNLLVQQVSWEYVECKKAVSKKQIDEHSNRGRLSRCKRTLDRPLGGLDGGKG